MRKGMQNARLLRQVARILRWGGVGIYCRGMSAALSVRMGRPTTYSPNIGEFICSHVAAGKGISEICANFPDMPKPGMVYQWLRNNPEFADLYSCARDELADKLAAEIVQIADTDPDSLRARNRMNARMWYAAKLRPRVYGDKLDLNSNINVVATLTVEQSLRRLSSLLTLDGIAEPSEAEPTSAQLPDNSTS